MKGHRKEIKNNNNVTVIIICNIIISPHRLLVTVTTCYCFVKINEPQNHQYKYNLSQPFYKHHFLDSKTSSSFFLGLLFSPPPSSSSRIFVTSKPYYLISKSAKITNTSRDPTTATVHCTLTAEYLFVGYTMPQDWHWHWRVEGPGGGSFPLRPRGLLPVLLLPLLLLVGFHPAGGLSCRRGGKRLKAEGDGGFVLQGGWIRAHEYFVC